MRNITVILFVFLLYLFLEVLMLRINKLKGYRNYIGREVMRVIFAFYMICLISDVIITPTYGDVSQTFKPEFNAINLIPFKECVNTTNFDYKAIMDIIKNIFLFVPMAIYFCFYNRNVRSISSTIILFLLISMVMQGALLTQNILIGTDRNITMTYVVLNVLGAVFGNLIFRLLYRTRLNIAVY